MYHSHMYHTADGDPRCHRECGTAPVRRAQGARSRSCRMLNLRNPKDGSLMNVSGIRGGEEKDEEED